MDGRYSRLWLVLCHYHARDFRDLRSRPGALACFAGQASENFSESGKLDLRTRRNLSDCSLSCAPMAGVISLPSRMDWIYSAAGSFEQAFGIALFSWRSLGG